MAVPEAGVRGCYPDRLKRPVLMLRYTDTNVNLQTEKILSHTATVQSGTEDAYNTVTAISTHISLAFIYIVLNQNSYSYAEFTDPKFDLIGTGNAMCQVSISGLTFVSCYKLPDFIIGHIGQYQITTQVGATRFPPHFYTD